MADGNTSSTSGSRALKTGVGAMARKTEIARYRSFKDEKQEPQQPGHLRKQQLKREAQEEETAGKVNARILSSKWIGHMRAGKLEELQDDVKVLANEHHLDIEGKEAVLQMHDVDLDDAEDQFREAADKHVVNIDSLIEIQASRIAQLDEDFKLKVEILKNQFHTETQEIIEDHKTFKHEVEVVLREVANQEAAIEQEEAARANAEYQMTKDDNIEAESHMKSRYEEQIARIREKCIKCHNDFEQITSNNQKEYKKLLEEDEILSRKLDQKMRQVQKLQSSITHWKIKVQQTKEESEERNAQLKVEKEQLQKHFQELKQKMNLLRNEETRRLSDLAVNARESTKRLQEQLNVADRILRMAQLCSKYETEREQVQPFPASRSIDVESVEWKSSESQLKEEIQEVLSDEGLDEWTYLDNFLKKYNKVLLDTLAIRREKKTVMEENAQLRSILRQFLDGVSVNDEVLNKPNPLFVVNGKMELNHLPMMRTSSKTVVVEAATHVRSLSPKITESATKSGPSYR
eukprot:GHVT01031345.1.p3 GENE.GHVT01031345.1~~GHVT01031345.1.p3  ORF type:complete len:519 (-),score=79.85 GHVT01031345.1:989-2545(-)